MEKNREAIGNRIQVAGLSRQCSNHRATTTHGHQSPSHSMLLSGTAIQEGGTVTVPLSRHSSSTTQQYGMWRGLVAVGDRSSVARALAAQVSDLGSIPSSFPVLFLHSPFQPVLVSIPY